MGGLSLIQPGLAGAAGALTRYLLGRFVAERVLSQLPVGTFINISGAFLIGLIAGLVGQKVVSTAVQLVLATGFPVSTAKDSRRHRGWILWNDPACSAQQSSPGLAGERMAL